MEPEAGAYDLVSAQFMQPAKDVRDPLIHRLANAVASAGTLLIVGHHPSDLDTTVRHPRAVGVLYTAEDVAALLDVTLWSVVVKRSPRA